MIWGKHALEAAISNKNRKIIIIYHTPEMSDWVYQNLKNKKKTKY